MSERFDALWALARADMELAALERSRAILPSRVALAEIAETFQGLERVRALLEPERAPLQGQLDALEAEVAHLADRRAQIEARLAAATGGGKELEAMHAEVTHLAERTETLEEAELELMEALEPLNERLEALRTEGRPLLEERVRLEGSFVREETDLDTQLSERRVARAVLESAVEPDLLALYQRGVTRNNGDAGASLLEHGTCSGCHLSLPAAERDRLGHLDPAEVSICEQCDRILLRPAQLSS